MLPDRGQSGAGRGVLHRKRKHKRRSREPNEMWAVNQTHHCVPMGIVCTCRTAAARQRSNKKTMPMVMLQQMVAVAILLQALQTTHGFTNEHIHSTHYSYRMRDRPSPQASASSRMHALTPPSLSPTSSSGDTIGTSSCKEQTNQSVPDADIAPEQLRPLDVNIVLIDNYDSYTYNLYQYLACICVNPPVVVANDAYGSWEELVEAESAHGRRIDAVVISPGPGTPTCEKDVGICQEVVRNNPHLPILGVCLGHQLLGHHYGANVTLSPGGPVHGMVSPVRYTLDDSFSKLEVDGDTWNLFDGIEQDFGVVRYHSLAVQFPSNENDLASLDIEPIAWCDAVPPSTTAKTDNGANPAKQSEKISTKVCMALRHKSSPHYGVQFHPESIGTGKAGYQILYNFCKHVEASRLPKEPKDLEGASSIKQALSSGPKAEAKLNGATDVEENKPMKSVHTVHIHKISPTDGSPNPIPQVVFEQLYGTSPSAFWLDSSTGEVSDIDGNFVDPTADKPKCPIRSNSRFSIMGDDSGPLSKRVEYYGEDHDAAERGTKIFSHRSDEPSAYEMHYDHDNILDYLRKSMGGRGVSLSTRSVYFDDADGESYTFEDVDEFSTDNSADNHGASSSALPFEYRGGYVGYLGYEVRHDSRKFLCEQEICNLDIGSSQSRPSPQIHSDKNIPTAAFLFADRSLVYDHFTSDWYLVGVSSNEIHAAGSGGVVSTVEWMRQASAKLQSLQNHPVVGTIGDSKTDKKSELSFRLDRSKAQYEQDIRRCHEEIRNGESYELCLTNQIRSTVHSNDSDGPFGLYNILRRRNPAPFSAFLRLARLSIEEDETIVSSSSSSRSASVSICCSSPERFLSVNKLVAAEDLADSDDAYSHGWEFAPRRTSDRSSHDLGYKYQVESKPIKGTTARIFAQDTDGSGGDHSEEDARVAEELRLDVKNRAENLMIVDLLRNDLSRVCEVGSVHVPRLMHIESFTTVHQLVSTIRGVINSIEANAVDVISACFPGGSMTGAPKIRSVDILNEMEQGVSRGPYSGSLGYISLNGCMDMNIIIRTAVVTPAKGDEILKEQNCEWNVSIGCGGAITALSDSEDEYNEMLLKARAVKEAVEYWAGDTDSTGRI